MEEGYDGTLELCTTACVDSGGAEGLPYDVLAYVGGDEQRDTRAQSVALLQQLVEYQYDDAGKEQLQYDEYRIARTQVLDVAVHA